MTQKMSIRNYSIAIGLILIWGFFAIATPNFLSARNLSMLFIELSITATLALGMFLICCRDKLICLWAAVWD